MKISITPNLVLMVLILWRLLSVVIVQTSDVPDEYWQSLEVAHKLAFGYGHLTWEWRRHIRSYIYPFFISILYKILELLQLDHATILIVAPRIFQAILSGYSDYRFYLWTKSTWATLVLALNWFWYYCASRTITNTVETALTTIALSLFPWESSARSNSSFLWIVGLTCAIRPTMAITWAPLCAFHILTHRIKDRTSLHRSLLQLLPQYFIIGLTTVTYSVIIDSLCYKTLVITQWEFFKANVLDNIAGFYGTHNVLWYLTSALPVLAGSYAFYLPIAIFQILKTSKLNSREFILVITIIWTIIIYSALDHKEFRFILPILPMILYICTCTRMPALLTVDGNLKRAFIGFFLLSNLVPMGYFSLLHQRGGLEVMGLLRGELEKFEGSRNDGGIDVMFLTPCHALPLYSHVHRNVTMKFLSCEPGDGVRDEAEEFFGDPMTWVRREFQGETGIPEFVVMFDSVEERLDEFLGNYRIIAKRFHAHFSQGNHGKFVSVYRRI